MSKTQEIERSVIYALEIATAVVSLYVVLRVALGPDVFTRLKMGTARTVARTAKRQADTWTVVAGKADTVYWQARNTIL